MSMAKELYDVAYNLHSGKPKVSEDKDQLVAFLIYHFIIDNYSRTIEKVESTKRLDDLKNMNVSLSYI